jgi:hypothetical protein
MPGTLRVSRHNHILDRYRTWDVVVDGEVVGSVGNGRTCELPVPCGTHTVRVGHRWLASPDRTFTIKYADQFEFVCRPRPNPMIWIPYGVASLVRHDLFIVLEPIADVGLVDAHTGTSGNNGTAGE